jgi:hypothetical protein
VEVDGEPGGAGEAVEDAPEPAHRTFLRPEDDERVVDVLEHVAGKPVDEGVLEVPVHLDQTLQHVRHDEEEVGGERIPCLSPRRRSIHSPGIPLSRIADLEVVRI